MSQRDGYEYGVPCWVDTLQPDPDAAIAFYAGVFGWEFGTPGEMPGDPPGRYLVAQLRGRDVTRASQLQAELDDLREEVIYLKVKLRKEGNLARVEYSDVRDRIAGAWFGRCAGCALGKPIETWPTEDIERYLRSTDQWPPRDYLVAVDTEALGFPDFKPSWPRATRPPREGARMSSNELLGVYLNDHLAGSAAGTELAEKLRDNNQGTELGTTMAALHRDIEQDRATLEELMARLNVKQHPVKEAAGWLLERLSRLRLNPALTGSAELTRLLETEALSLGIEGKLAMWLALKEAAAADARLAGTDFDRLIERARGQRRALEPHRLAAAVESFSA